MAVNKGFNIRAIFGLETKGFQKGLSKARGKLTTFQKGLKSTNDVLRGLKFAAIGVTAVGAFSRAITVMKSFQDEMARVKVLSGASADQLERISNKSKELGKTTRFSASEAASGFQFLAMAGLNVEEQINSIEASMNLAGASMVDMGTSADILTNLMSGFNIEAEKSSDISDLLAHTTSVSNTNLQQLYEGMKEAAPLAAQLGYSIEDVANSMALMANRGIQGQRAGVAMSGALARLLRQPPLVSKALDQLGVKVTETSLRQDGFIGTLNRMRDAGITATQMANILGLHVKTVGAIMSVTDEEINNMSESISGFTGRAEEMSKEGIGGISNALKLLNSALEDVIINSGENGLSGILVSIIDGARSLILYLGSLSKETILFQGAMGLLLLKGGSLVKFFTTTKRLIPIFIRGMKGGAISVKVLGNALKVALGPIGLIIIGLEGITYALKQISGDDVFKNANKLFSSEHLSRAEKWDIFGKSQAETLAIATRRGEQFTKMSKMSIVELDKILKTEKKRFEIAKENTDINDGKQLALLREESNEITWLTKTIEGLNAEKQKSIKHIDEESNEYRNSVAEQQKATEVSQTVLDNHIQTLGELKEETASLKTAIDGYNISQKNEILATQAQIDANEKLIKSLTTIDQFKKSNLGDFKSLDGKTGGVNQDSTYADRKTKEKEKRDEGFWDVSAFMEQNTRDAARWQGEIDEIESLWGKLGNQIQSTDSLVGVFTNSIDGLTDAFEGLFTGAEGGFQNMVTSMLEGLSSIINGLFAQALAGLFATEVTTKGILGFGTAAVGMAALTGLWKSQIPAFANGGVFGGNNFSGDNNIARVNSGEMILNRGQQSNLFGMINSGGSGGGQVVFEIQGSKLVGVLNNEQRKNNKFT